MKSETIKPILEKIRNGELEIEQGVEILSSIAYKDLGYAKVDTDRESRVGHPEVIYCPGKTTEQIRGIVACLLSRDNNILATRANADIYRSVRRLAKNAAYNPLAKTITIRLKEVEITRTYIAVITAGTSDLPVAEEASVTAEFFGNRVERVTDVGVAGIHRLFDKLDLIRGAKVIIAVAGMEGALASVIGGLVDKPVIAVPTSVGYGANFKGLAALLSMLNSCANGISVVNIDNGYGAGYLAGMINRL